MKLSKAIAQRIVLEMMNVIPYNINVMDENGIIIGSGDNERIGNIHEGAKRAIDSKHIIEIYEDNEKMKPGVNEPIIFNNEIIGVIGITGYPDEVIRFSKLVRVTAVLLIEQIIIDEDMHNKRLNKQRFYYELAHRKTEYDNKFHEVAKEYGIDITKGCQVVLIENNNNLLDFKAICERYFYYSEINNRGMFFITSDYEYNSLLRELEKSTLVNKISIGPKELIVANSVEKAGLALEVGRKIKPSNLIYLYDEFELFINLSHENKKNFISLISNLDKVGHSLELIETMQTYIEENGDINKIANKLKIHRNTLNYRLDRIKQLTGKNPKNLLELFELICGLIWR